MTSIFKSNKFFRIIKHFVLCIPLMFVLGISIYTIVNPNAKDSYTDYTREETLLVDDKINLISGTDYIFVVNDYTRTITSPVYYFSYSDYNFNSYFNLQNVDNFCVFTHANGNRRFGTYVNGAFTYGAIMTTNVPTINFISTGVVTGGAENTSFFDLYSLYAYQGTLDNAFEFGMSRFTQVGFNKFDFVGLFDGIFTDNIHNVYTDFINSYLNYYLMIECVYFVPWVIHMFIHFAYDLGDYFTSSFKRNRKEDD